MNTLNFGSLEASKRLVDVGIVLETEHCWQWKDPCSPDDMAYGAYGEWILVQRSIDHIDAECIPAPSMAEVWRELTDYKDLAPALKKDGYYTCAYYDCEDNTGLGYSSDLNPTDALIDLLIWVRKEK